MADKPSAQDGRAWPTCGGCGKPHIPRGLGTALKPAHEPICVARKPLDGTVAQNVLAHGTGAMNVDACRIEYEQGGSLASNPSLRSSVKGGNGGHIIATEAKSREMTPHVAGRWPANVVLDERAAAMLDEQTGDLHPNGCRQLATPTSDGTSQVPNASKLSTSAFFDKGGASRFFYTAKASSKERNAGLDERNTHPTVKPIALMRWLVRLVTPPGGLVLDPFAGSGTTGIACVLEGLDFHGIEREPDYVAIAEARIQHHAEQQAKQPPAQLTLV